MDNGSQFVSEDFFHFLKSNEVKFIRCAPYHPASNGLAEQSVQSLKMALKSTVNSELCLQHHLSNFLLSYRSTCMLLLVYLLHNCFCIVTLELAID